MSVVQLRKRLAGPPLIPVAAGFVIRNYRGPEDIPPWLALRHRAFARQKIGVRHWDVEDFEAEFSMKPWWSPERLWLAELNPPDVRLVGTVALAERAFGQPAVHWLAVDPRFRRQGIGRLLMSHLETFCWERGEREIWLETHSAWGAAAALYESLGYREVHSVHPGDD